MEDSVKEESQNEGEKLKEGEGREGENEHLNDNSISAEQVEKDVHTVCLICLN